MKKFSRNLFMAASVVTILNFSSCHKYEDGPGFTLKSKKGRLTGEWEVVKVTDKTGVNLLSFSGYDIEFEFQKDGDFRMKYAYSYSGQTYSYVYGGEWDWSSSKESVEVQIDGSNSIQTYDIRRLTSKELWLTDGSGYEWELEAL